MYIHGCEHTHTQNECLVLGDGKVLGHVTIFLKIKKVVIQQEEQQEHLTQYLLPSSRYYCVNNKMLLDLIFFSKRTCIIQI